MSARGKPCTRCGGEIVLVRTTNGGIFPVDPYPDPNGTIRVDVLGRHLVVLAADQPASARTRRYERHNCQPAGVPRPEHRPQQLAIGAEQ